MFEKLSEKNFLLYAAQNYDNPQVMDIEEFYSDIKRINYIKKLLNKYISSGDLKDRLLINHITILYNVFGVECATRLLFFKLNGYEKYLKPFLVFLNFMPNYIDGIDDTRIYSSSIEMDETIVNRLRKI